MTSKGSKFTFPLDRWLREGHGYNGMKGESSG